MQLMIFILRKLTLNIQPNLQPPAQWATTTATTMAALAVALVVWMAWSMALVPAMALDVMVVMALATSAPLSMEDIHHLDSSERPGHYLGTQFLLSNTSNMLPPCTCKFSDCKCPYLWWMIWMLYQDVVNCSAKWSISYYFSFCDISELAFE